MVPCLLRFCGFCLTSRGLLACSSISAGGVQGARQQGGSPPGPGSCCPSPRGAHVEDRTGPCSCPPSQLSGCRDAAGQWPGPFPRLLTAKCQGAWHQDVKPPLPGSSSPGCPHPAQQNTQGSPTEPWAYSMQPDSLRDTARGLQAPGPPWTSVPPSPWENTTWQVPSHAVRAHSALGHGGHSGHHGHRLMAGLFLSDQRLKPALSGRPSLWLFQAGWCMQPVALSWLEAHVVCSSGFAAWFSL